MAEEFAKPYPRPTPATEPFWAALNDERVLLQRCESCGAWNFYPRSHCANCLSDRLAWCEVSGQGTIYTYTIAHQPTSQHFVDEMPQIILMVDLDEGVRLTSTLIQRDIDLVKVGLRVKPYFDHIDEHTTMLRYQAA